MKPLLTASRKLEDYRYEETCKEAADVSDVRHSRHSPTIQELKDEPEPDEDRRRHSGYPHKKEGGHHAHDSRAWKEHKI